jgi:hypothetical protein
MRNFSHTDKRTLRKRPEFQSLLDQLEPEIEQNRSNANVLNVLSLRLLALDRRRIRFGEAADNDEQSSLRRGTTGTSPPSISDNKALDVAPTAALKTLPTSKLKSWLSRRRASEQAVND